ncbi:MAG TPA: penicillin-binding transpeptidase domain-containing protein, partial [Candidatus Sumerlaeota bacterium]|nr:penicillin-binding transpeptidase domain-containing protein [Candidatus Sumerlaeota bacterium]
EYLKGSYQETQIPVNSLRTGLAPIADEVIESTYGHNLILTIDEQIQMFTQRALRRRVGELQARSGVAIVMDVRTGGILALANCPDFDPNHFSETDDDQRLNRALTDPFEVGSVMKILTTTLLLDGGLLTPSENVNTGSGAVFLHGRWIRDVHAIGGWVPLRHAFAESSNVAMALLSERIEQVAYYQGLRRFGLGSSLGIDLPGEGSGILRPVEQWTAMSRASLAIGYETSLTPLQAVSALAAIGNNGWRMAPHVVQAVVSRDGRTIREFPGEPVERVANPETCANMLELMEAVVLEGTGKGRAEVPGFRVGGKTGTTVKHYRSDSGRKLYIASFAGLFPIDEPRVAIFVTVDEPRGAKYGGEVSAPVFREIALKVAHILGIPPSDPAEYEAYRRKEEGFVDPALRVAEDGDSSPSAEDNGVLAVDADSGGMPAALPVEPGRPVLPAVDLALAESLLPATGDEDAEAERPRMPDCLGLTMVEAWERLAEAGIEARMIGSGLAVRQDPAPGRRLPASRAAMVVFAQNTDVAQKASAGEDAFQAQ